MKPNIRAYALLNAFKFNGKASPGSVIGKLLKEHPNAKNDLKKWVIETSKIVTAVNKLSQQQQLEELRQTSPELLEEKPKEKREGLKPLRNAEKGKVVMRFAPSPSGPMHIGHAYVLSLNSEYCKLYNGKLILRIEDTNPANIFEKAYEMMEKEGDWLTDKNIFTFVIQSDRLGIYYDYCEKLIEGGGAYVCTCEQNVFKELINNKNGCPCRKRPSNDNLEGYHNMFVKYKPGEAVVRMKTDVKHKNPAMRDFPLMRISEENHPRIKKQQRVWPLMNLAVAIDDHDMGVTHTMRAKDQMDADKRQKFIYNFFKWKMPEPIYVGMINFDDIKISASETRRLIEEGVYTGWDDIRLPFLAALQRRGYKPEALRQYAVDIGVTQNDKTVTSKEYFTHLNALNKDLIDKEANRYFFIPDPVEITITKAPQKDITLTTHPDFPKRGKRKLTSHTKFLLTQEDYNELHSNKVYRLMSCLNFEKKGDTFTFHSEDLEVYKKNGEKIMHWLPNNNQLIEVEVLMPDNTIRKGVAEPAVKKLILGNIIQFERFGFCRLDHKEKLKLCFWFLHK